MNEPSVAVKATSAVTYTASGSALVFGLTANELAAYIGAAVAVLAWLSNMTINFWFKHQHLKLARQAVKSGKAQVVLEDGRDD